MQSQVDMTQSRAVHGMDMNEDKSGRSAQSTAGKQCYNKSNCFKLIRESSLLAMGTYNYSTTVHTNAVCLSNFQIKCQLFSQQFQ